VTPTLEQILETVGAFYGINTTALRGRRKYHSLSRPRHMFVWLAVQAKHHPLQISAFLSRDRTTVLHALLDFTERIQSDPHTELVARRLKERLTRNGGIHLPEPFDVFDLPEREPKRKRPPRKEPMPALQSSRRISKQDRLNAADLILRGIAAGVIRPEPTTNELAFNGLRYSIGRGNPKTQWTDMLAVMGEAKIVQAIAKSSTDRLDAARAPTKEVALAS
jgi:hypothetical protein